jgi:hydroxymethylglutaryl-CoA lyase
MAIHFHDTNYTAISNILKCLEYGVKVIDSSIGGLGGCPYAKKANGNVATENVIYLLD